MKKILCLTIAYIIFNSISYCQINPVKWNLKLENTSDSTLKNLKFSVEIESNWQLYSNDFDPNLGPIVTQFYYTVDKSFELVGGTIPENSKRKYDDLWGGDYSYFEKEGMFNQKIIINNKSPVIEVKVIYQVCNTTDGKCIPFDILLNTEYFKK